MTRVKRRVNSITWKVIVDCGWGNEPISTNRKWICIEEGIININLNLKSNNIGVVLIGDGLMIKKESSIKSTKRIAQITISKTYLDCVINALVKPIDGRGEISTFESQLIEFHTPNIISRCFMH